MVNPLVLAGLAAAGAVIAATVFFREEIGAAGSLVGGGLGDLGQGFGRLISSVFSPQITPRFVPTIGVNVINPFGGATTQSTQPTPQQPTTPQQPQGALEKFCNSPSGLLPPSIIICKAAGFSSRLSAQSTLGIPDEERSGSRSTQGLPPNTVARIGPRITEEQILEIGRGFTIPSIASDLGLGRLSSAEQVRLGVRSGDLGFQVRAFQRGEIGEDQLREGFRQAIA